MTRQIALRVTDVLLIAILIISVVKYWQNKPVSADSLMIVNQVHVSDHKTWADAEVVYDREIKSSFFASWVAKIYPVGGIETVCSGSGDHYYEPEEKIRNVTLSWFMETTCNLPAGDYYLKTTWVTQPGPVITNVSNVFTVL